MQKLLLKKIDAEIKNAVNECWYYYKHFINDQWRSKVTKKNLKEVLSDWELDEDGEQVAFYVGILRGLELAREATEKIKK